MKKKKKNPTFLSKTFFVPPPHFASHVNSQVLFKTFFWSCYNFFLKNKIKLFFSPPLLRQFTTQKLPDLLSFIKLKKKTGYSFSLHPPLASSIFFFFHLEQKKISTAFQQTRIHYRLSMHNSQSISILKSPESYEKKKRKHTHTKRPILLCYLKQ